jgi:hypothetical protein
VLEYEMLRQVVSAVQAEPFGSLCGNKVDELSEGASLSVLELPPWAVIVRRLGDRIQHVEKPRWSCPVGVQGANQTVADLLLRRGAG